MSYRTETGLVIGAAEVVCVAEVNGYAILWVQTAHTRVELQITPKGRKIIVRSGLNSVKS
jgi:hypothetical protein